MTGPLVNEDHNMIAELEKYTRERESQVHYLKNYMKNERQVAFEGHLIATTLDTLSTLNRSFYVEGSEKDKIMDRIFELLTELRK